MDARWLERLKELRLLATNGGAHLRTLKDAVTEDGARVSPYPELVEIIDAAAHSAQVQAQLVEAKKTWRCFHCEFVTSDPKVALAHFGDRDDAEEFKPICKWWDRMDGAERKETLQDTLLQLNESEDELMAAEAELVKLREQIRQQREFLEYLNRRGGQGYEIHGRIEELLKGKALGETGPETPSREDKLETGPEKK